MEITGQKRGRDKAGTDREPAKRKYEKRRRAQHEAETRRRITEAAVRLHGSIGPARTTVRGIADEAGVQRATVYRHFPDDDALFAACSAHWMAQNPPPKPASWQPIADPRERLRTALIDVYAYYARTERMLSNNTRDAGVVPALRPSLERFMTYFDRTRRALLRGRPERGRARRFVGAAVGHALGFVTWRSLVREQGLSREEAVELMVRMVG